MPVRRGPVVDGRTRGLCKSPNDDIELGTAGNDFHFEFFLHMNKHFETWL